MAKKAKKGPVISMGLPEWVMTFGDMMTLLLTFFILLFSISEPKKPKVDELVKSMAWYWGVEIPMGALDVESVGDIVEYLATSVTDAAPDGSQGKEGHASDTIEQAYGEKSVVSKIDDTLHLELAGRVLFDEASAELLPEGRDLLLEMRRDLAGYPNRIRIIGHCSPLPLPATSAYRDHDDLAFQRSLAVAAMLTAEMKDEPPVEWERLEIASRGSRDPLPGLDVFDAAQRARLARVEIIVTPENAMSHTEPAKPGEQGK